VGGGDEDGDAKTTELACNIAKNIPDLFDITEATKKYPIKYEQSMNTVLQQVFNLFILKIHTIIPLYSTHIIIYNYYFYIIKYLSY